MIFSGIFFTLSNPAFSSDETTSPLFEEIYQEWIVETDGISRTKIHSGKFYSPAIVQTLYENNSYRPLWSDLFNRRYWLDDVEKALAELESDALPMWRYHLDRIRELRTQDDQASLLDIYLTDSLVNSINDLSGQLIPNSEIDKQWRMRADTVDVSETVSALRFGASLSATLESLRPAHPQYDLLRTAFMQAMQATPPKQLVDGEKLQPGDRGESVYRLMERLVAEGLLDTTPAHSQDATYNGAVTQAVTRFQLSRGLSADGVTGWQTHAALNADPVETARKIALNLQRWRNSPADFPGSHILVNTAAQRMELIEDGEKILEMNVIVGKRSRQTPSFSELMTHVVLNPDWNIPTRIAHEEILPSLRKDRSIAETRGIRALQGNTPVDWSDITDEQLHSGEFPYRLQQVASDDNALGRYKFLFPNPYMVYLHDTPYKGLFNENSRALSHGCVRLQHPEKLAQHLLANNGWNHSRVNRTVSTGERQTIELDKPIPVFMMYLTSWVNDEGRLEIFSDTYRQDSSIDNMLAAMASPPLLGHGDVTVANLQIDEPREKHGVNAAQNLN